MYLTPTPPRPPEPAPQPPAARPGPENFQPKHPRGYSKSNLEPTLRHQGTLERPRGVRKPGRPRIVASWFPKVAETMADGTSLGTALAINGIHLSKSEVNQERVQGLAEAELKQSSKAVGTILCKREANLHYRHHYSLMTYFNNSACLAVPALRTVLSRFQVRDTKFDPITNEPYALSWSEASSRTAKYAKTS